jgi:hypothetical protein
MPATPKVSVTVQTPKPGAPAVVTAKVEPTPLPSPGAPASKPSEPAVEEKSVMGGLDKNAMIFGAVALGALALGALLLRKPSATPNRATGRFAGLPPVGRTMEVGESGKKRRIGHGTPPKKYREMGATKPSDYAWPEGFMYPIHDAKHVRAAASRFGKYKASYPLKMRQTIAKRLNAAKKKFGVGGKPATPNRSR